VYNEKISGTALIISFESPFQNILSCFRNWQK